MTSGTQGSGRISRFLRWATLGTALLGAGLHVGLGRAPGALATAAAVIAYVSLETILAYRGPSAVSRRTGRVRWVIFDVLVAAAVLGGTGGLASPYLLYGAVITIAAGNTAGRLLGGLSGAALSIASVTAFINVEPETFKDEPLLVIVAAFVLIATGILGGSERQADAAEYEAAEQAYLRDLLTELLDVASRDPQILDDRSGAHRIVADVDRATGEEALVLLRRADQLVGAASSRRTVAPGVVVRLEQVKGGRVREGSALARQLDDVGFDGRVVSELPSDLGVVIASEKVDRSVVSAGARQLSNAASFQSLRAMVIDQERRRLAADLHDGLAQVLTHLRFELDLAASGLVEAESLPKELERLARIAERALQEARSTVTGLQASVVQEGLVATLRSYIDDLAGLAGPGLVFEATSEVTLPGPVEQEVFRVVQEAVSNALRHSGAHTIRVHVSRVVDDVVILITDDGKGFRADKEVTDGSLISGFGLGTMRDRMQRLGGELRVQSRPGVGTVVELRCPQETARTG